MFICFGEEMDWKDRIKIVSTIDIVYAVLYIIAGILVIIFAKGWLDLMGLTSSYSYGYNPFTWMNMAPWIILVMGISSIVYGIKKLVEDILGIMIINEERIREVNNRQVTYQPPYEK